MSSPHLALSDQQCFGLAPFSLFSTSMLPQRSVCRQNVFILLEHMLHIMGLSGRAQSGHCQGSIPTFVWRNWGKSRSVSWIIDDYVGPILRFYQNICCDKLRKTAVCITNWWEQGRNQLQSISKYYPSICLEGLRIFKTSVQLLLSTISLLTYRLYWQAAAVCPQFSQFFTNANSKRFSQ
jgi:hypothetical protein